MNNLIMNLEIFFTNDDDFECWNMTTINVIMGMLIFRYDIIASERIKKIIPISKPFYDYLNNLMEKFINWYKNNKTDCYISSQGISPVISVELLEKVYIMNKQNKKLYLILKTWYGDQFKNFKRGKKIRRISYLKLKDNIKERILILLMSNKNIIIYILLILFFLKLYYLI